MTLLFDPASWGMECCAQSCEYGMFAINLSGLDWGFSQLVIMGTCLNNFKFCIAKAFFDSCVSEGLKADMSFSSC
jgi:hypothetical protein